ncbi:hypothetical protein HMPREF1547_03459 [Blautia sp. KLE 1732]|nr:hypothetical protein HMPREF1547_03459 [Blautia sp. KLE 1732]
MFFLPYYLIYFSLFTLLSSLSTRGIFVDNIFLAIFFYICIIFLK